MSAGALARAARLAAPGRGRLALALVAGVLAVGSAIALLATSGYLISRAAQGPPILTLTVAIVAVRACAIGRALFRYVERLSSHDVALRVLAGMRRRLYERLVPLVPGGIPAMRPGDLLSRLVADVDAMQDLFVRVLGPPVVAVVVCAGASGVAWAILPQAGLVLAVVLLGSAVALTAAAATSGRRAARRQAGARAALTAEIVEDVRLAPDLAAYGLEDERVDRVRALDADLARTARADAAAGATTTGALAALAGLAAAAVLWVGIPAVADGRLDGVLLAALALLALASVEALAPLPAAAQRLRAMATAAGRLEEVSRRRPPVADPAEPLPVPARPALALEGARLRWSEDGPWVLDGVDLRLDPGRRAAVVGRSGAGKSTVASVLARFRDLDGGRALLDGRDLSRYAQDDLRRAVRLCDQDAHLFAASIRDNVRIGRTGAEDGEVLDALRRAGLGDWVAGLPDGLDTQVGEDGAEVSGGQRSRIALARTLVSRAPVLVLDEPTAHLDPAGTGAFVRDLLDGAGDDSVLLITHSPIGLDRFDEVIVLHDGRIADRGTHAELVARSDLYRELMALDISSGAPR
ncbi:MAG: thiol reductant ABC exporter subunit CydC [Thermoleophilia bacterium]